MVEKLKYWSERKGIALEKVPIAKKNSLQELSRVSYCLSFSGFSSISTKFLSLVSILRSLQGGFSIYSSNNGDLNHFALKLAFNVEQSLRMDRGKT